MSSRLPGSPDPYEMYDAAYVMGALDEADRSAYEQHLQACDACTAAVAELRGLPPLLARVQRTAADRRAASVPPMPDTLLPGMLREARRSRVRRRTLLGAAAAAVAVGLVGTTLAISGNDSSPDPGGQPLAMSTASAVPLQASLRLEPKAWGTQIVMSCRYDGGDSPEWKRPTYELVVLPRGGGSAQTIARWSVLPHKDATIVGSTELPTSQIDQVQVRTTAGAVILTS